MMTHPRCPLRMRKTNKRQRCSAAIIDTFNASTENVCAKTPDILGKQKLSSERRAAVFGRCFEIIDRPNRSISQFTSNGNFHVVDYS